MPARPQVRLPRDSKVAGSNPAAPSAKVPGNGRFFRRPRMPFWLGSAEATTSCPERPRNLAGRSRGTALSPSGARQISAGRAASQPPRQRRHARPPSLRLTVEVVVLELDACAFGCFGDEAHLDLARLLE